MEYKTSNWQLLVYIILLSGLIYSKFKPKKKAENEPQNIYVNPKINPSFSPISGGPDNTLKSNESIKVNPKINTEYTPSNNLIENSTDKKQQNIINKTNSLDGKELNKYFNDIDELNKTNSNSYLNKNSKFNLYSKEKTAKDSI
jgi:hypothetical protein